MKNTTIIGLQVPQQDIKLIVKGERRGELKCCRMTVDSIHITAQEI